jgi:predicted glycosyltransferase
MAEPRRHALHAAAARLQRVIVQDFSEDMMSLLDAADLVVSMGGYNTVCELLTLRKRAIVVPRVKPGREQWVRADRMAALGLLRMLDPAQADPASLADAVISALAAPAMHNVEMPPLDGLDRCVEALFEQIGIEASTSDATVEDAAPSHRAAACGRIAARA